MTSRTARTLAWGTLVAVIVLASIAVVFVALGWDTPQPSSLFGPRSNALVWGVTFAITGAVIASRRPENPIGWLLCAAAVIAAIQGLAEAYALWALLDQGGRPPLGEWAAWVDEWFWMFGMLTLGTAAALYPDGRWLSRRWRNAMIVGFVLCGLSMLAAAFTPELVLFEGIDNPVGVTGMTVDEFYRLVGIASIGFLVPVIVGFASAFVRFRRSTGDEREQLKWLTGSVGLAVTILAVYLIAYLVTSGTSVTEIDASRFDWVESLIVLAVLTIPASITVGVLKYRLYDIDLVISKAVVYGALALAITVVYVAIVVGVGALVGSRGSTFLSAVAAAVVALAFQPLRRRVQHLANRVVYGKRSTPYEVLSGFGERVGETYSIDDVLPRMARLLGEAVGAQRVAVWLAVAGGFEPAAGWPGTDGLRRAAALPDGATEVRHQGELLGALTVDMPPTEPLDGVGTKLVADLAGHAGLVLRNARLIEELRASRQRLVSAQDQERRRIERNIHDGAQQQLVALTVHLRLLEQLIARDPVAAQETAARLQGDATTALEDLRDLARGIYPPLLVDKGLAAALEAQARRSVVPTTVTPDGVGRLDQDVEATVYFCVLEAMQNVAKYAKASAVTVTLSQRDGLLRFEVRDDGRGFDATATNYGTGLQGMADRLAVLGGEISVQSEPGGGTAVRGSLPVETTP